MATAPSWSSERKRRAGFVLDEQAVPPGGADGQVLTKTSGVDYATAWENAAGGGGEGDALTHPQAMSRVSLRF